MEPPAGFRYIDAHTHLHPPRLFAAIRRWFDEHTDWSLRGPSEPDEVVAALRAAASCPVGSLADAVRSVSQMTRDISKGIPRRPLSGTGRRRSAMPWGASVPIVQRLTALVLRVR